MFLLTNSMVRFQRRRMTDALAGLWLQNLKPQSNRGRRDGDELQGEYVATQMVKEMELLKSEGWDLGDKAYSIAISAVAGYGNSKVAQQLFDDMVDSGKVPGPSVYVSLLFACSHDKTDHDGKKFFSTWDKLRLSHPDTPISGGMVASVVHGLCKRNQLDSALHAAATFKKQGSHLTTPVYNMLLAACDDMDDARPILQEMKDEGFELDIVSYGSLFKVCSKTLDTDEADRLMTELKLNKNMKLSVKEWTGYLTVFKAAGLHERVAEIWEEMIADNIEPNSIAYGALIKSHCDALKFTSDNKYAVAATEAFEDAKKRDCITSTRILTVMMELYSLLRDAPAADSLLEYAKKKNLRIDGYCKKYYSKATDSKMSTYDSYGKSPINALAGSPISISSTAAKGKAELLQLAVNESKGEIQSLRSNVGTLQDTISGHAHTLQLYKNQLRDKDEENRSLAVAVQTLKKEVADARRSADDGDRVQLKYTGVTSKLQQELDEERVRSSRVKQDMDLSIERCDAAERALEDLRRVQAQLTDELARSQEQQRRSNDDLISRETQLQRVASTATQQNEDSQVELRSLRVRSSELEVILQERERELLTLQERAKQQGVEALHGQEELGRLRRQLSESGLQTQTLSERINSSEQIRRQLESEIDGWCNKHDDSQRKSDDLTRQLEDRVCELERLQRAIHGKEDEIEELRERGRHQSSQVGEHEAGIRSLEKQLQERLEHISYTEAKLAGQEKDLSERTSRCDELSRERTAFMQQVEKLNVDLDDSHTEILRIREESNMLREQTRADLEESRRQSSAAKADLSAARGKIAQLEGRVATAEDLRADAQAQLRDSEAQSAQFQARLAEQRRELSEWGAVIVKLQGEKEDAQNATDVLEQERISLSAQVGRLQQKNAEYREELRISRDEVQVLHDATNKREQEIENLQRALEDKHLQLQTLDDKCQQQAQTIGDRMRDIRSLQQQLDDEKNATGTAALEISRLEGRLAAKDEDILSLKEKNSFLKDQMIRLETQVRRLENLPSVIETQEAELVRLRQSLSRAEDEAQNYARSSQTLQQRVSEKEVSCDELQMKINELSIEMQNIIRIRDDLECQVTEKAQEGIRMKGSIARFEGRIDAMDEAYRQSQMKCNAQESEKEALRKQVDASLNEASIMERELNSYRERTGALEISRDTAERQASENSITLIRAKEEMTGAREQAAAVQEEVNKLRQLSHLPAILEHKEAELLRLREAIDVTGKQSDGHVATVRDLSARTSDLEALLNEKDREANDLRRELSRKAQDAEAAMTELATKNNEVIRLRTNLARLDGRLQVMTEATEDEKGKAALLEDELRQIRTGATPSSVMTPRASAVSSTWQRSGSGIKIGLSPRRDRTPSPGSKDSLITAKRVSASMIGSTRPFSPLKREELIPPMARNTPERIRDSGLGSAPVTPTGTMSRVPYQSRLATLTSVSARNSPLRAGRSPPRSGRSLLAARSYIPGMP